MLDRVRPAGYLGVVNKSPRRTFMRALLVLMAFVAMISPNLGAQSTGQPVEEAIDIDANAPAHAFPHFWESMFGSGRAILTLREATATTFAL